MRSNTNVRSWRRVPETMRISLTADKADDLMAMLRSMETDDE